MKITGLDLVIIGWRVDVGWDNVCGGELCGGEEVDEEIELELLEKNGVKFGEKPEALEWWTFWWCSDDVAKGAWNWVIEGTKDSDVDSEERHD